MTENSQFIAKPEVLKNNTNELRLQLGNSEEDDHFHDRSLIRRAKLMNSSHFVCLVMTVTFVVSLCTVLLVVQIMQRYTDQKH